jgi:hypothetical protein
MISATTSTELFLVTNIAMLHDADRNELMTNTFKVGDHVTWNSEAGWVSGRIVKVHTRNVNRMGYVHHASVDSPQYEIQSDKTDHVALHKPEALRHFDR